jgi:hypothetical protein
MFAMTGTKTDDWSPADHPYAIAVSEAQWWQRAAQLAVLRLRDDDDRRISWFSSRQIDARQLLFALRQLLNAERLEQVALTALGVDPAVSKALAQARQRFENALPGIKQMRDAPMHFDEWSRGEGKFGPQKQRRDAGAALRDVARAYSGFGYDPTKATITLGPYTINVDTADRVADELSQAIYLAAHEVDKKNTAELRVRTIAALTNAGIRCDTPDASLKASSGKDLRIWLSLNTAPDESERERAVLAEQIIGALTSQGLVSNRPTRPRPSTRPGACYEPRECTSSRTGEERNDLARDPSVRVTTRSEASRWI